MTNKAKSRALRHNMTHSATVPDSHSQKSDGVDLVGMIIMAMLILPIIPP